MKRGFRGALVAFSGAMMVWAGSVSTVAAQSAPAGDQYSGNAYAVGLVGVTVAGIAIPNTIIGDSGQLPVGGGAVSFGPGTVNVAGVASATILTDAANGSNGVSTATSQVTAVSVPATTPLVQATVLSANSGVNCGGNQTPASTVATLTIGGIAVPIPAGANQTITVPLVASVTLREELYDPTTNTATTNALVIRLLAPLTAGTITIAHADSDLRCPPFTVDKTANGQATATVAPGSNVTYGVTLTNQVNTSCALNSVSDLLPPQPGEGGVPFTYVSGGPPGGAVSKTTVGGQNIVTWTFATPPVIAVGGKFAFNFVAHVPSNEPAGTYFNVLRYTSTCGPGSGLQGTTTSASGGLAGVTVTGVPVPITGAGSPAQMLPVAMGVLGAVLIAGGSVDAIVSRRRSQNGVPLT